jgi:hypothetical protein
MTTTTETPDLYSGPELTAAERADLEEYLAVMQDANALDADTDGYVGLTPDLKVCNCLCGRLLLARRHEHLRPDKYTVKDGDSLPPIVFRKRVMRQGEVVRSVPICFECEHDGTAAVRCAGKYAVA